MRVLTWNLFHGRALPSAGRDLNRAFADLLAGWSWDVALLQEVPPWWGPSLGRACAASARTALTSRNAGLPARRALATRCPDLIKSNGGGANTILVRGPVLEHRRLALRLRPERRVLHAVRLSGGGWVGNLHAQVHSEARAQADLRAGAAALLAWGGDAPLILGGDTNVQRPAAPPFAWRGGHNVDHVLARGWERVGAERLDAGPLSDHAPVLVELERG